MRIGKKELIWNYSANILKLSTSVFLFPIILNKLPVEDVALWTILSTVTSFAGLLDFGFGPSFTRNVTYVFSGVKQLKSEGIEVNIKKESVINYNLLKGVIDSMKWFYSRMALLLFIILITLGTIYLKTVLKGYHGDVQEIYITWFFLCVVSTFTLYSNYYDSLLQGRGLVMRSKQIVVVGQLVYFGVSFCLIIYDFGLKSLFISQGLSIILVRFMSYYSFYSNELKGQLSIIDSKIRNDVLAVIAPNAIKTGLTSLAAFIVSRSSLIFASLTMTLNETASYGLSMQLIGVISGIASIYMSTYMPKIFSLRVQNKISQIKVIYIRGFAVLLILYIISGIFLVTLGDFTMKVIKSNANLLTPSLLILAIIIAFLESNHAMAGNILISNNQIPFFKAALFAGALTLLMIVISKVWLDLGLISLILIPGIAQLYNNWKWPYEVILQLGISWQDIKSSLLKSCCQKNKIGANTF